MYRLVCCFVFFFFKQKTAYELRISDWSSDVCSSDLFYGASVSRSSSRSFSGKPGPGLDHRCPSEYKRTHEADTRNRQVRTTARAVPGTGADPQERKSVA